MFERFRSLLATTASSEVVAGSSQIAGIRADGAMVFKGFDDPELLEMIRGSGGNGGLDFKSVMRNPTVCRCVSLIANSIALLPLHLFNSDDEKSKAIDHPLYQLLLQMPNEWQTAFEFKQFMTMQVLIYGNAYAYKVRSGNRIVRLVPIHAKDMELNQKTDWSIEYKYTGTKYSRRVFSQDDIFHLRGLSDDGVTGVSICSLAGDAIALAKSTDKSAKNLFENGVSAGGALEVPSQLSDEAYERLQNDLRDKYSGSSNRGKYMILEEGLKLSDVKSNRDNQQIENRRYQVEEVARVFGVPRPLLGIDETSWGSGISELGQLFVRYGLLSWFTVWEQAIFRDLLSKSERGVYFARFNAGALTRGSLTDQGEFFAKALGSGGHPSWMTQNEVRDIQDLPRHGDGDSLTNANSNGGSDQ